jgi:hypothetical protein
MRENDSGQAALRALVFCIQSRRLTSTSRSCAVLIESVAKRYRLRAVVIRDG